MTLSSIASSPNAAIRRFWSSAAVRGRILAHLARAGFRVTGVDASLPMLALARQQIDQDTRLERRVHLEEADMRTFSLRTRFRMALCAINSFMHLMTPQDQATCVSNVHHHLVSGGLFIVDIFNPDLALLLEGGGRLMLERMLVDPATSTMVTKMVSAWVDRAKQVNHVTYLYDEMVQDGTVKRTVATISQRYLYRLRDGASAAEEWLRRRECVRQL